MIECSIFFLILKVDRECMQLRNLSNLMHLIMTSKNKVHTTYRSRAEKACLIHAIHFKVQERMYPSFYMFYILLQRFEGHLFGLQFFVLPVSLGNDYLG